MNILIVLLPDFPEYSIICVDHNGTLRVGVYFVIKRNWKT